jgi:two-component system, NarL family, response regulator YdfI
VKSAPDAESAITKSAITLTKVFILADSTTEIARLSAMIRSAPTLELAGASVNPNILIDQLEDLEEATRAVFLEHFHAGLSKDLFADEFVFDRVARIILTEQAEFAGSIAKMTEEDSAIRAILPAWANKKEILAAIEAVSAGLIVIHPDALGEFSSEGNERVAFIPDHSLRELPDSPVQQLSPRESEVLNLLADGLANKEIARRLEISEHTVKFHITSIFNKLNASTRAEAVAIGARRGLIIL